MDWGQSAKVKMENGKLKMRHAQVSNGPKRWFVQAAVILLFFLPGLLAFSGCAEFGKMFKDKPRNDPAQNSADSESTKAVEQWARSPAIRDTIGEATTVQGLRAMRVRGYGVVTGLGITGSKTCPDRIRKQVIAEMLKRYPPDLTGPDQAKVNPEQIIGRQDTAIVEVEGEIPAGALKGSSFDLTLVAVPGSDTTSLEGGYLLPCDLKLFRQIDEATVQEGKIIAEGRGSVFLNPFSQREDSATPTNLRQGRVIAGGVALEDRRIQLQLITASYAAASRIQERINGKFGTNPRVASAESPSYVSLKIPRSFLGRELDFVAHVRHLYLSESPEFTDRRIQELSDAIRDANAPHDSIGLAWEGIGKTVKPIVQNLYSDKQNHVSYFSARTGLHLGDNLAIGVLERHAINPDSSYQTEAISELGWATEKPAAANVLLKILTGNQDFRIRMAAYEALIHHNEPSLNTTPLDMDFVLDTVTTVDGPPMIYAKTGQHARIVVVGDPRCRTPLLFRHSRGVVTMSAEPEADHLTLIRTTPNGLVSPALEGPLNVVELIQFMGNKARENKSGQVTGLGMAYSQILDVISSLCADGTIPAEFRFERIGAVDITAPSKWIGRPESDL